MDPARRPFVLAVLHQASEDLIDAYKTSTFPPDIAAFLPYTDLSWVNVEKFDAFLRAKDASDASTASVGTSGSSVSPSTPATRDAGVSASGSIADQKGPPASHVSVKQEPADIIDLVSDSEPEAPTTSKVASKSKRRRGGNKSDKSGRIQVTRDIFVDRVVHFGYKDLPPHWPASADAVAYVVDFTGDARAAQTTAGGVPVGMDSFLKKEDMDSWGAGSNGSTSRDTSLILLGKIPSRRSTHRCNGALRCEFFETSLLEGYRRLDSTDMAPTQRIFSRELEQNARDAVTAEGRAASFLRVIESYREEGCPHPNCDGVPKLISYPGVHKSGRTMFVGCSAWKPGQTKHRHGWIPKDVNENLLKSLIYGSASPLPSAAPQGIDTSGFGHGSCASFRHPNTGQKTPCQHPHFVDGHRVTASMVRHECPVRKIVYTSKDPKVSKCVVVIEGVHTHPPWPLHKAGLVAVNDAKESLAASGKMGITSGDLNSAPTTKALLGGTLDSKHAVFRDKRTLRKETNKIKAALNPEGLTWKGIQKMYEDDLKLPLEERYVHDIRCEGTIKIAVCMRPDLIQLIHDPGVIYVVCDFTFKRTRGELNEWEVAIWYTPQRKRVAIARVWSNRFTKDAYKLMFDAFFKSVKTVTGREPCFKALHENGNLHCILFDMEAAQMQGFGEKLVDIVNSDPELRKLFPDPNPDKLVQCVAKLCTVHWERSTKALVGEVGQETVNYLNTFLGMSKKEHIDGWHNFCSKHPSKKLRDWYAHKIQYPWLLPCFNESLSQFPPGLWGDTQTHTNLVEGAHSRANRATGTNLMPVESVQSAREWDSEVAASIRAARETCILSDKNNHDHARMRRAMTRGAAREDKREACIDVADELEQAKAEVAKAKAAVASAAAAKKEIEARVKELKAQQKLLGRAVVRGPRAASDIPSLTVNNTAPGSDGEDGELAEEEVELDAYGHDALADTNTTHMSPPSPRFDSYDALPLSSPPPSSPLPMLNPLASDDSFFGLSDDSYPQDLNGIPPLDLDAIFAGVSTVQPALAGDFSDYYDLFDIPAAPIQNYFNPDVQMDDNWILPPAHASPAFDIGASLPTLPPPPTLPSPLPSPKGTPPPMPSVIGQKRPRDEVDANLIVSGTRTRIKRVRKD
ncbi:hypothetical protein FB45DRAFT_1074470 [Roridomyces roridus]|uniref:Uncharacterized protein n=1 Tax=Roridomyces roridus TaxID=1738132 RepID=A0AAD7F5C1_9AGAR|nr:hypothetical protein FB45DRAFT_1074470 [Roridomyces roridus]